MAKSRKQVEQKIYDVIGKLEPSGANVKKYKDMFSKMSDKEFKQFFLDMKNDENKNFYVEMDLYGKSKIGMSNIEAAAKVLNLPLEEYVYFRHKSPDGKVYRSPYKVPIIYLHLKRMQQILSKKTLMNYEIMGPGVRSRMTGSLSDSAKSGRLTDSDTISLMSITDNIEKVEGEDSSNSAILKEILGARADNTSSKMKMHNEISFYGSSKMNRYEGEVVKTSQAANTLDVFLIGAGLKSDIITPSITTVQGLGATREKPSAK